MSSAAFYVWNGVYPTFCAAPAMGPGFDGPIWRERSLQATREAAASLAAGDTLDYALRERNAVLPIVAAIILSQQNSVDILDFGGGLGGAYIVVSSVLGENIDHASYKIVEVDGICQAGRDLFATRRGPTFQSELPAGGKFDIVHASSVLQYIEDWRAAIRRLASYRAQYLVFGDVFIGQFPSYVTLQTYYDSRIPVWFLNASEFIAEVERQGYELTLRAPCNGKILGAYDNLPMKNFPPELRIARTSHLVFSTSQHRIDTSAQR